MLISNKIHYFRNFTLQKTTYLEQIGGCLFLLTDGMVMTSTSPMLLLGWKVISDYRIFFAFWQMD